MCIRDSRVVVQHPVAGFLTDEDLYAVGFQAAVEQGQDFPCLLYTSDAADDLLCVDLGGRRIIKKQKQYLKTSPSCIAHDRTSA